MIIRLTGADYSTHKAVGEGEDLRFDSTPGIAGGALFARDRIVHMCAFVSGERQAALGANRTAGMRHLRIRVFDLLRFVQYRITKIGLAK